MTLPRRQPIKLTPRAHRGRFHKVRGTRQTVMHFAIGVPRKV